MDFFFLWPLIFAFDPPVQVVLGILVVVFGGTMISESGKSLGRPQGKAQEQADRLMSLLGLLLMAVGFGWSYWAL